MATLRTCLTLALAIAPSPRSGSGQSFTRSVIACLAAALVLSTAITHAQTGDGSLRGYVKDAQGGVSPGVTVTATSAALLTPVVAATDASGYYRLLNLPPGTYPITSELVGFSTYRREGLVMRAGLILTVAHRRHRDGARQSRRNGHRLRRFADDRDQRPPAS